MGRGGFGVGVFVLLSVALLVATIEAMSGTEPAKEAKAGGEGTGAKAGEAAVHIVYMENPKEEEAEAYHVRTLTTVLGRSLSLSHSPSRPLNLHVCYNSYSFALCVEVEIIVVWFVC